MKSKIYLVHSIILGLGMTIAIGVGLGTAIGLVTEELLMGIALGLVISVGLVLLIWTGIRRKKKKDKSKKFDKEGFLKK